MLIYESFLYIINTKYSIIIINTKLSMYILLCGLSRFTARLSEIIIVVIVIFINLDVPIFWNVLRLKVFRFYLSKYILKFHICACVFIHQEMCLLSYK